MKSLRDVLPMGMQTIILRQSLPEEEQIKVEVRGIDIADLGALFNHFPEIYAALTGGKFDASSLASTMPARAVNSLIAAGTGVLGDVEAEKGIGNLALFDKIALLVPIVKMTMPDGPGPFVELVKALGLTLDGAAAPQVLAPGVKAAA